MTRTIAAAISSLMPLLRAVQPPLDGSYQTDWAGRDGYAPLARTIVVVNEAPLVDVTLTVTGYMTPATGAGDIEVVHPEVT